MDKKSHPTKPIAEKIPEFLEDPEDEEDFENLAAVYFKKRASLRFHEKEAERLRRETNEMLAKHSFLGNMKGMLDKAVKKKEEKRKKDEEEEKAAMEVDVPSGSAAKKAKLVPPRSSSLKPSPKKIVHYHDVGDKKVPCVRENCTPGQAPLKQ